MNGIFTDAESARLSAEERIHYLSVGLCTPVMEWEIETLAEQLSENDRIVELEDELESVRSELRARESEHDELLSQVGLFERYLKAMPAATADEIRDKARELDLI